jgi:protein SCO1/2
MNAKLFSLASAAALLMTVPRCRGESATNAARPSCCASPLVAAQPLTDKSLYQLDSTWFDDNGHALKLASLRGRPQVVCMFFANCQSACPVMVHKMKQIEQALPENLRTNVGFLLVSFDPERDTPAVLHDYRVRNDLAIGRWSLLRGAADDVLELAALLGVKFKKENGQFMHSNMLTVLNCEGEIAFQEIGLSLSPERVVEGLLRQSARMQPSLPQKPHSQ